MGHQKYKVPGRGPSKHESIHAEPCIMHRQDRGQSTVSIKRCARRSQLQCHALADFHDHSAVGLAGPIPESPQASNPSQAPKRMPNIGIQVSNLFCTVYAVVYTRACVVHVFSCMLVCCKCVCFTCGRYPDQDIPWRIVECVGM